MTDLPDTQRVVVWLLIAFSLGTITLYVAYNPTSDFVTGTIVPGLWAVLLIAVGATYRKLGLGKDEAVMRTA